MLTQQLQRHLLVMLVRDLGYDRPPPYGHAPARHQHAWALAIDGIDPARVADEIADVKARAAAEGHPFQDYAARPDGPRRGDSFQ